jgi:uncharacterized protein YqeY
MTKEELKQRYIFKKTIKIDDLEIVLREPSNKEMLDLKQALYDDKGQPAPDKERKTIKIFEELLPFLMVSHNVEGTTTEEVVEIVMSSIELFNKVFGEYMSFLSERLSPKVKA